MNSDCPNTTDDSPNTAVQTQGSKYERSKLKFIIDGWVSFYKILIPFRIECIEIPYYKELALDKFQVGATLRKEAIRGYDKEPIVIKNPYEFFLKNLDLFCFIGAFVILSTACIDYADNIHKKEIKILLYFPFMFVILHIIWAFYYYIIKNKCETKFTNKTIEFIINGEVKRVKNLTDLEPITRNFKLSYSLGVYFHLFLFFLIILISISEKSLLYVFIIMVYYILWFLLNFLFKFIFHLILGGELKGFSLYPAIIFDYPQYIGGRLWRLATIDMRLYGGKFHMVYIIKKQDYLDLQKYFSDKKHINLNLVEKKF